MKCLQSKKIYILVLLSVVLALLCSIVLCVCPAQGRYTNEVRWKGVYLTPEIQLGSNCLVAGGQTVLLDTWRPGAPAKNIDILISASEVAKGAITCSVDKPEFVSPTLDREWLEIGKDSSEAVGLVLAPVEAAVSSIQEPVTVTVHVEWKAATGGLEKILSADFVMTLQPATESIPPNSDSTPSLPDTNESDSSTENGAATSEDTDLQPPSGSGTQPLEEDSSLTQENNSFVSSEIDSVQGLKEDAMNTETQNQTPPESLHAEAVLPASAASIAQEKTAEVEENQEYSQQLDKKQDDQPAISSAAPAVEEPLPQGILFENSSVRFLPPQPIALWLAPQIECDTVTLSLEAEEFPPFTRYSTDGGATYIVLADGGTVEIACRGKSRTPVLLDFSWTELVDRAALGLSATAWSGITQLAQQILSVIPEPGYPILSIAAPARPLLAAEESLTFMLGGCAEDTGLEILLEYLNENGYQMRAWEECGLEIAYDAVEHCIAVRNPAGKAAAGTYRITVRQTRLGLTISNTQTAFFVNYE